MISNNTKLEATELTNEELIASGKTNDVIETIIIKNKGLIYDTMKKLNMMGDDMAYAVGAEAMYRAVLDYKLDSKAKFSTYASMCMYNAIAGHIRSTKRKKHTFATSLEQELIDMDSKDKAKFMDSGVDVCEECISNDTVERIMKCTEEILKIPMSKKSKAVLTTWYESKFTLQAYELANIHECSRAYVSTTIGFFRKELKSRMKGL